MKLRNKFAIAMIIMGIIIIVSISGFYNYYFRRSKIEEEVVNAQNIATNYALQLDNELKDIINNLVTLTSAPVIKHYLLKSNSYYNSLTNYKRNKEINKLNEQWKATNETSASFVQKHMNNPAADFLKLQQKNNPEFYGEIFLSNRYGVMVSTTNKLTTLAHSHKYWWKASYNKGNGKIFLDDRGFDTSVQGYVLGVTVPVKHNNQVIGILKCNINIINLLTGVINKYNKLYDYGQLKVVRTGGRVVYELGVPPLTTKVSTNIIKYLSEKEISTRITYNGGKNGIIGISTIKSTLNATDKIAFGGSYESEDHLKGNKGENWHILLSISKKSVLNEFNEKNKVFIYTGIVFVLLTAIISFIFGDKLSQPILRISSAAKKIGKGNLKNRIEINRKDEIGDLANIVNQMADNLKKTMVSKTRLEKILQTTQDGYWMVNLKGEIIDVNKAYINMIGYSRQELVGMSITNIDVIEDNAKTKNHINKVKEKGHGFFETKHKIKNNNIIDVEVSTSFINAKDPFFVVFIRDVTERKEKNRKIKNIKERLELAIDGAKLGIWDWNIKTGYIEFNKNWAHMLGYKVSELDNHLDTWKHLLHEDDEGRVLKLLKEHLNGKSSIYKIIHRLKTKEGKYKWILDIGKVIERDNEGNPLRAVGIHQDIDDRKRAEEEMKYLSFHDKMTGLYNRRYFENEMERLNKSRKLPISIVVGDMDRLKYINDNYGHKIGDKCIKKSAEIISSFSRGEDIVARIGGDEFAIILLETGSGVVKKICKRIKNEFKKTNINKDLKKSLSISLGSATMKKEEQDLNNIFDRADKRMYENKKSKT